MDPHLAYIYLPTAEYNLVKTKAQSVFGSAITCDTADRPCYFPTTCNDVPSEDLNFQISLKDTVHTS